MAVILVVEDDEVNLALVTRFLTREGHVVHHAGNGVAGISAAKEHLPDLIVMDMGLPEMDGWEAVQCIRKSAETAHIPIVALTAHALAEDVHRAIAVGCNAYQTKPVAYLRLMKTIAELVSKSNEDKLTAALSHDTPVPVK
jgi:CheY-like chemotaxis protein